MPSYVITGVSRGLGFGFLEKLSSDPANTVIGLVRDVPATKAKTDALKRSNIHIIKGDLNDYESLQKAAEATSAITSGSLDYLIANAALISHYSAYDTFSQLGRKGAERLTQDLLDCFNTNVVGNVHLFNLFMPLILKGQGKKVVTISSGLADEELTVKYGLHEGAPYSISKAAMNMASAKFQAEYQKDGVLFLSLSPGSVNTGQYDDMSEEEQKGAAAMGEKFLKYAPHFAGPITVEESVDAVLKVMENASLEKGDAGAFLSHTGNKSWL